MTTCFFTMTNVNPKTVYNYVKTVMDLCFGTTSAGGFDGAGSRRETGDLDLTFVQGTT